MTAKTRDAYALINHKPPTNGSPYGKIVLSFVYKSDENGKPRNFSDYESLDQAFYLNDLTIEGTYSTEDKTIKLFSMTTQYDDKYRVDLTAARAMVKTLEKIDKGLSKLNDQYGYVADGDYAAYALRVLSILKCKGIVRVSKESHGWSYDDSEYNTYELSMLQYMVSTITYDLNKQYSKVMAE